MSDKVNHPGHYTWLKEKCGIEVIDITRHLDFCIGNAVKYLLRAGHKSEEGYTDTEKTIEDLKKAVWYINDKIKQYECQGATISVIGTDTGTKVRGRSWEDVKTEN